jgi:hypothetical protein
MSLQIVLNQWQANLILVAWAYGLCAMLFVLVTKRDLLARSSRELFQEFPDIAVAIAIILTIFPQLLGALIADSVFYFR